MYINLNNGYIKKKINKNIKLKKVYSPQWTGKIKLTIATNTKFQSLQYVYA